MRLTFKTNVEIDGLHLMTNDQKFALLDTVIGTLSAPAMKDWLRNSEFKSLLQEAAIAALHLEPRITSTGNTMHDDAEDAEDVRDHS